MFCLCDVLKLIIRYCCTILNELWNNIYNVVLPHFVFSNDMSPY